METHTHRPENSGRLYSNEPYEDNPAASPAAMRTQRSEAYTRRAKLLRDADDVVRDIDRALDGSTPTPEPEPHRREQDTVEAEPVPTKLPVRRRLGDVAILITNIEETVGAPPRTEAA